MGRSRTHRVMVRTTVDNARRRVSSLVDGLNRGLLQRFPDCGYKNLGVSVAFAERVCCDSGGAITPDAAFSFWKGVPIANGNMLDPRFRYVGVSRECPVDDQCYWTLTLGSEPSGVTEAVPSNSPGGACRSAPAQVPPVP